LHFPGQVSNQFSLRWLNASPGKLSIIYGSDHAFLEIRKHAARTFSFIVGMSVEICMICMLAGSTKKARRKSQKTANNRKDIGRFEFPPALSLLTF
jgi:hypothetical protein